LHGLGDGDVFAMGCRRWRVLDVILLRITGGGGADIITLTSPHLKGDNYAGEDN